MQGAGVAKTEATAVAVTGPVEGELQQVGIECPRCRSTNTKFCYYNNYNLSQPRYFCKGCRRYWTKGGALRNIPVGGGTRKNSKRSSSAASSSSSSYTTITTTSTTNCSSSSPQQSNNPTKRLHSPSPSSNDANNINIHSIQTDPLNITYNPFLKPAPISIPYPTFEINGCSFSSLLGQSATWQLYGGLYESFADGETGLLAGTNEINMGLSLAGTPTVIDMHSSTDSSGNEIGATATVGGVTGDPLPESLLGSTTQGDSTGCWSGGWSTDLAIYTPGSGFVP